MFFKETIGINRGEAAKQKGKKKKMNCTFITFYYSSLDREPSSDWLSFFNKFITNPFLLMYSFCHHRLENSAVNLD